MLFHARCDGNLALSQQNASHSVPEQRVSHKRITNLPRKNLPLFHTPYPIRQGAIEYEICNHSPQRPVLGSVPSELVISVEGCACNQDGGVAECESDVGEKMRLLEFERCEVIGEGVVGGVFEFYGRGLARVVSSREVGMPERE